MTYNRKRKIRIIKGLRKVLKEKRHRNDMLIYFSNEYPLYLAEKPWNYILYSILRKYKKQISKNEVNEKRKAATEKKNAERFHIDFWRLKNVEMAD